MEVSAVVILVDPMAEVTECTDVQPMVTHVLMDTAMEVDWVFQSWEVSLEVLF